MNKRKFLIATVLLPVVFFVAWITSLEMQSIWKTQEVKIAVKGYDPRDLLSGHYISLRVDWANTDCQQFADKSCPLDGFDAVYRFYMPEQEAQQLDKEIRQQGDLLKMKLVFLYAPQQAPSLKNLMINGATWQEYLNQGR